MNQLPQPKYQHFISSEERTDGGPGFLLVSDRPFAEVATDMLRSAIQIAKGAPSVLGHNRRDNIEQHKRPK